MDQIAEAIAIMVLDRDRKEEARQIVKGLTDRYPLNA